MARKACFSGRLVKDRQTKKLANRLKGGEIALIEHPDLDEVAAECLWRGGVKVILNTCAFCTGLFHPHAVEYLLRKGVHLVEGVDRQLFEHSREGEILIVREGGVYRGRQQIGRGRVVTEEVCRQYRLQVLEKQAGVVDRFVVNTLDHAYRERQLVTGTLELPPLKTSFCRRHAVVVVRGKGYRDDLRAIKTYIREQNPVLIGVDGGADALLEYGFLPDIIIGDMDSVSDRSLRLGRERVVHAYHDGRGIPGKSRLEALNLDYLVFSAPGTSEDIALLMAYEMGAELIVAIGTHSSVLEFLEKGRAGMSSTFLVRLKVGDRLVDAKGVSRLYNRRLPGVLLPVVLLAGLMPAVVLVIFSPLVQHLFRLLAIKLRFFP